MSARLTYLVEPGPVEELPEDERDLRRDDPGSVIFDNDPEDVVAGFFDADKNIGEDLGFFTGIQRIIHGFFDGSNNPPGRGIETEQVLVLLEKFSYADTSLLFCEFVSEDHALPPRQWLKQLHRLLFPGPEVFQGNGPGFSLTVPDYNDKSGSFGSVRNLGPKPAFEKIHFCPDSCSPECTRNRNCPFSPFHRADNSHDRLFFETGVVTE